MSTKPNLQPTLQALLDRDRRGLDEHPDPETLEDYHAGKITGAKQEALRDHLALCHDCADFLLDLVSFAEFTPPDQAPLLADVEVESAWQKFQPRLVAAEPVAAPKEEERLVPVAQIAERRRESEGSGGFVPRQRLRQAYAIAATLLVGVIGLGIWAGSLQKTIGHIREPQPNPKVLNLTPEGESGTRGEPEQQEVGPSQESFMLSFDPVDTLENTEYAAEIVDSSHRVVWESRGLYKSPDEGVVRVRMPEGYLKAGEYKARLFSMKGAEKTDMKNFHFSIASDPTR
jgi:hypothetical protein